MNRTLVKVCSAVIILITFAVILFSCSDSPLSHEETVDTLFSDNSDNSESLTFDDIVKNISEYNMTSELIDESRTEAKISTGDDVYYTVNPNYNSDIKFSPLDTFIEILNNCKYFETNSLNEPVLYTFIFNAVDISETTNEICVYVTRSCVRFTYNGISDGKEYVNMSENDNYKNICDGYDFYINGIIPDENEQLATIW